MAIATEPAQLLVYRFGAHAAFEGWFAGALERVEAGGALRVLELLIVARDAETGELVAGELRGTSAVGFAGGLVGLRLDPAERRRATRRALARPDGLAAALGETLEPGEALGVVLLGHAWRRTLNDAVQRTSGTQVLDAMVGEHTLTDLSGEVLAAARQRV